MTESFPIPINYQGEVYEFKARFERRGFSHSFAVPIGKTTFAFERDEEGGYPTMTSAKMPLTPTIGNKTGFRL